MSRSFHQKQTNKTKQNKTQNKTKQNKTKQKQKQKQSKTKQNKNKNKTKQNKTNKKQNKCAHHMQIIFRNMRLMSKFEYIFLPKGTKCAQGWENVYNSYSLLEYHTSSASRRGCPFYSDSRLCHCSIVFDGIRASWLHFGLNGIKDLQIKRWDKNKHDQSMHMWSLKEAYGFWEYPMHPIVSGIGLGLGLGVKCVEYNQGDDTRIP